MTCWRRRFWCAALLAALLAWSSAATAERYFYDSSDRLILVIHEDLSSIAYAYDANGNISSVSTTGSGIPGDADLDGDVDDADIAVILSIVLGGGQPYSPTADCNADDSVTVLDLVCAVNAKGAAP